MQECAGQGRQTLVVKEENLVVKEANLVVRVVKKAAKVVAKVEKGVSRRRARFLSVGTVGSSISTLRRRAPPV